jgi:hypothetical protein
MMSEMTMFVNSLEQSYMMGPKDSLPVVKNVCLPVSGIPLTTSRNSLASHLGCPTVSLHLLPWIEVYIVDEWHTVVNGCTILNNRFRQALILFFVACHNLFIL